MVEVVGVVEVFVVDVVVVVVDELVCASWPTAIVTVLPFLAVEFPPGLWATTTPFLSWLVTFRVSGDLEARRRRAR